MKKLNIITISALGLSGILAQGVSAQETAGTAAAANLASVSAVPAPTGVTEPRERIYVQTDKDYYLSGELVWIKLTTTTIDGAPVSLSRVGYIEIVDDEGSRVRERINLGGVGGGLGSVGVGGGGVGGVGQGSVLLPSTLPTGYYRIVGYTRWMRNEGPAVFFEKTIGVVNPLTAEVSRGDESGAADAAVAALTTGAGAGAGTAVQAGGELTVVPSGGGSYSPRAEITLDIGAIPADIHTLSVSVTGRDLAGGFTRPGQVVRAPGATNFTGRYAAEYEGPIVTGTIRRTDTGEPVAATGTGPVISFPGSEMNLFPGRVDAAGRVSFQTPRIAGFTEAATSLLAPGDGNYRIDLDEPFTTRPITKPLPTFPFERIDRNAMLNQSMAMQLQYAYVNDSLNQGYKPDPHFWERPDYSYAMEEWRRFATMPEVVTEFLKMLRFFRDGDHQRLQVINRDFPTTRTWSLVLIDGVPVIDHNIVYNYNPLLLNRVDVFYDRYVFESNIVYGIVAFYTEQSSYPDLQPDPFTQIAAYDSPQAERMFYSPDYSSATTRASRLPDYRHTLYWNADVPVESGTGGGDGAARVRFHASDLRGSYQVMVEGVCASGQIVRGVIPIEVR